MSPSRPRAAPLAARAAWNASRSKASADFFTCGYAGRKLEELLDALQSAGVRCVVDVRRHAMSRFRPELSKRNFAEALGKHGIGYLHLPELGVPREIRALAVEAGSTDPIWEWYDERVASLLSLQRFLDLAEHPVALMCTEADPTECHRHRLCLALEEKGLRGYDL